MNHEKVIKDIIRRLEASLDENANQYLKNQMLRDAYKETKQLLNQLSIKE